MVVTLADYSSVASRVTQLTFNITCPTDPLSVLSEGPALSITTYHVDYLNSPISGTTHTVTDISDGNCFSFETKIFMNPNSNLEAEAEIDTFTYDLAANTISVSNNNRTDLVGETYPFEARIYDAGTGLQVVTSVIDDFNVVFTGPANIACFNTEWMSRPSELHVVKLGAPDSILFINRIENTVANT